MKLHQVHASLACVMLLAGCSGTSSNEAVTAASASSSSAQALKAEDLIAESVELKEENVYFDESGTELSYEEALLKIEGGEKELAGNVKLTEMMGSPFRCDAFYSGANMTLTNLPNVFDIQSCIDVDGNLGEEQEAEFKEALAGIDAWAGTYSFGKVTFNYEATQEESKMIGLYYIPRLNIYEMTLDDGSTAKAVVAVEGGIYQLKIK